MSSDLYRFEITEHASEPAAQLAIDWSGTGTGPGALAKRVRAVLGRAAYPDAVVLLRDHLRALPPTERRAAVITPVAKVAAYEHPMLAAALGLTIDRRGEKTSPASLDALAASLAALDREAFGTLLEGMWLRAPSGYVVQELWLLHALLHQIDPGTVAPPRTARVSLEVEAIHPNVKMPPSTGEDVENLALRMLGFLELGGALDALARGTTITRPLGLPFCAVLTDRKPRSGKLHVLSTTAALAPYTVGMGEATTAWA